MSGGHYNYASFKLEEFINTFEANTKERENFKKLLYLVADAMYDIEWVDSGDKSPGDENNSIDKCLNFGKNNK